jgi:hypothetical protein
MKIVIDVGERTPEQEAQLDDYYRAAELLRKAGFPYAHVTRLCVFGPRDLVATIHLEKE